jgi:prevent-host-death family protein
LLKELKYPNVEQYNIHEAKTILSKLLQKAEKGQEVIISKSGKPVAV